jgi:hypothetical protein
LCKSKKSIQEYKGPGCSKTFIHDRESYQLMTINAVYSKHAGKMTMQFIQNMLEK